MNGIVVASPAFERTKGFILRLAFVEPFLLSPFSLAVPFLHLWDKEELAGSLLHCYV